MLPSEHLFITIFGFCIEPLFVNHLRDMHFYMQSVSLRRAIPSFHFFLPTTFYETTILLFFSVLLGIYPKQLKLSYEFCFVFSSMHSFDA